MESIDFLFISPLGWDKMIWKKLISYDIFKGKNIDFIEFKGGSFYKTKNEIFSEINHKIKHLSDKGTIITSSFGTVTFLNFIASTSSSNIKTTQTVILLDGIDTVEDKTILKTLFKNNFSPSFKTKEEYLITVLSDDELKNNFLNSLLLKNIYITEGKEYKLVTKEKDIYNYLVEFSNINNKELLYSYYNKFNKVYVFSHISIDTNNCIKFYSISPEQHLLMLTNTDMIIEVLKK